MRLAVIDIGTNTVLLLVAEVDAHGEIITLHNEQRVIRLGEGIQSGIITVEATKRLIAALAELKSIATGQFQVKKFCAVGTSVFRRALNAQDVVLKVRRATDITIEILSGDDEARWTFVGATHGIAKNESACVLDIGGGSMEVVVGKGKNITFAKSLEIGVVLLREEYYHEFPLSPAAQTMVRDAIMKRIGDVADAVAVMSPNTCVAVAGTPTTLAALSLGLSAYDATHVDGTVLTTEYIMNQCMMLQTLTLYELRALPCVDERRADVLPAGALMLAAFLERAGIKQVRVSDRGVRYGIASRELRKTSA